MTIIRQSNQSRFDKYTNEAIKIFFIGWLIAVAILLVFFDMAMWNAVKWAFLGWSVLYFGLLFRMFWLNPGANYAVILEDPLKPLRNPRSDQEMTQQDKIPRNQRVVPAGLHGKRPWEKPIGPAIFLGREELVSEEVTVLDKDEVPYIVPYQFSMTALPGEWLIRHNIANVNPAIAKGAFNKIIQRKIQVEFAKGKGEKTIEKPEAFFLEIQGILGGPNALHPDEIENGYYTRKIEVGAIKLDPEVQKAHQAKKLNALRADAIADLMKKINTPAGALAAKLTLAHEGGNVTFLEFGGVENLTGSMQLAGITELLAAKAKGGKKP